MILAFDTSAAQCAAALRFADGRVKTHVELLGKGQAERLMPMLEEVLAEHGQHWSDLTRIGVGVGPGNFTGIRISVSAARGLALGLGIPAIGISTLDAIHHRYPKATAAVTAPRDMLYIQKSEDFPRLAPAESVSNPVFSPDADTMIAAMAELASQADPVTAGRPKPMYIKPADAAPSRDAAPVILS